MRWRVRPKIIANVPRLERHGCEWPRGNRGTHWGEFHLFGGGRLAGDAGAPSRYRQHRSRLHARMASQRRADNRTRSFAEKVVARNSGLPRRWPKAYVESPYTRAANVLEDLGFGGARVGFEKDGLSAAHWEEIQSALPKLQMINCSRMMDEVRWIKTAGEIALQKKAADMLDDVLIEVFPTIRAGESEREVHARIVECCLRHGFGWIHGILNASSNMVMYGGESDVKFEKGDFVRNDYVAYYKGYAGPQSRLAILGKPNDESRWATP